MPKKTEGYQLNQWEANDDFLRTDFNEDNAKIEEALNQKCEVVFGTYKGDGTTIREIVLGFQPKAVILDNHRGVRNNQLSGVPYGGIFFPDASLNDGAVITETGFRVLQDTNHFCNYSGWTYHYIAFK